jgi:putative phosphoesterase
MMPPMKRATLAATKTVHLREDVRLDGETATVAVVSDTHGRPHPDLDARLRAIGPVHILHGGDVGDLGVLRALERHAPVTAVRGNIDAHDLPDFVTVSVLAAGALRLRILLTHMAVYGPKLRADVARVASAEDASLVVCGHSHVPFAGVDRGMTVFNPGSVGPRRFRLPITLGAIDFTAGGVSVRHVDCETGLPWRP